MLGEWDANPPHLARFIQHNQQTFPYELPLLLLLG